MNSNLKPLQEHLDPDWTADITTSPGWDSLLLELHEELVKIYPDYKIPQVKEKFGGLRFYWSSEVKWLKENPAPLGKEDVKDRFPQWNKAFHEWQETTDEGRAYKRAHDLVAEAEDKSFTICEICGQPGKPSTPNGFWRRTLCPKHTIEENLAAR